jgi:hypothetical protein
MEGKWIVGESKKDVKQLEVPPSFFLVVINDEADTGPQVVRCETPEDFTRAVEEHILGAKSILHAFAFKGVRIPIGAPNPVCAIELDGKRVQVGEQATRFAETGRIVPLRSTERETAADS